MCIIVAMMKTTQLVSMISVTDVERSIEFYRHLGFEVGNTFRPEGTTKLSWAWLNSGAAQLMLSAATEPVGDKHSVLFYAYTEDVEAAHATLGEAGLNPGAITKPFYSPRGEFATVDPDGYVVMVTHT
jgi:predicted enzyme related to lactoylglutathione lyase